MAPQGWDGRWYLTAAYHASLQSSLAGPRRLGQSRHVAGGAGCAAQSAGSGASCWCHAGFRQSPQWQRLFLGYHHGVHGHCYGLSVSAVVRPNMVG